MLIIKNFQKKFKWDKISMPVPCIRYRFSIFIVPVFQPGYSIFIRISFFIISEGLLKQRILTVIGCHIQHYCIGIIIPHCSQNSRSLHRIIPFFCQNGHRFFHMFVYGSLRQRVSSGQQKTSTYNRT